MFSFVWEQSIHNVYNGDFQLLYTVRQEIFRRITSNFQIFPNIFEFLQDLLIKPWLLFDNSFSTFLVCRQCRLLCYFPSSWTFARPLCCCTASFFSSNTNREQRSVGKLLSRPHNVPCWCIIVSVQDVLNIITFTHGTHKVIDPEFTPCISIFFCSCLSSAFVDPVVSLVSWLVGLVYKLWLFSFYRWCQCNSVD